MQHGRLSADAAPKAYFAAVLGGLLLSIIVAFTEGDTRIFLSYVLPQLCYMAAVIGYIKIAKIPFLQVVPFRKPVKPVAILLAVAVTVGIYCQNLILAVSFQWLIEAVGIQAEVILPDFTNAVNLALGILIVCIMPAVGEELMFRGLALSSFKEKGAASAMFLSAAMFALSHGNAAQLVHQFLLGAVLAYLTLRTGNIIYAMLIHFINNLLAITLPLIIPAYNALAVCNTQNALIMLGLAAAGVAVLYPSLYLLVKKAGTEGCSIRGYFTKSSDTCYNSVDQRGAAYIAKLVQKAWLFGLFAFLAVQLVINTVLAAIPDIKGLFS